MNKLLGKAAFIFFGLSCHVTAQTRTSIDTKCVKNDYVKIGISDGKRPKHVLFAAVPCENITPFTDSFLTFSSGNNLPFEVFRFRRTESNAPELTAFEYLGEGGPLSSRAVVVTLTTEMLKQFENGGLDLDNVPTARKYALVVLRKGKPIAEIVSMLKDPKTLEGYIKEHLVLYAYPENSGANF